RRHMPEIIIDYDNPDSVGTDRLVNVMAVKELYGLPAVIVDFGTATTLDVINKDKKYLGGLIIPGIAISMDALFSRASMLPKIELAMPRRIVAKSTAESMQNGIYYMNTCGIDGIIQNIIDDEFKGEKVHVIGTGGLSDFLSKRSRFINTIDQTVTLKGLKIIYDRTVKGGGRSGKKKK
ncbi:type III pantothenate kinase, partial [Spirochaetota bacterium]